GPSRAFLTPRPERFASGSSDTGVACRVPESFDAERVIVVAHATDRMSEHRGPIPLTVESNRVARRDEFPPQVKIASPDVGTTVVPGRRVFAELEVADDTGSVSSVRWRDGSERVVARLTGKYGQRKCTRPYDVPFDITSGQVELGVIVEDPS